MKNKIYTLKDNCNLQNLYDSICNMYDIANQEGIRPEDIPVDIMFPATGDMDGKVFATLPVHMVVLAESIKKPRLAIITDHIDESIRQLLCENDEIKKYLKSLAN